MTRKLRTLNLYIDESGDFGMGASSSKFYLIALVLHEERFPINKQEKYLNERLEKLGYTGMIHSSPLIAKKDEYSKYSIETRKKILWLLFNFTRSVNINISSILVEKKYINSTNHLVNKLEVELRKFIINNKTYLNSFDSINIYYDNGQIALTKIINNVFSELSNINRIAKFDKKQNRLFQIADMVTAIDKVNYKIKNKIILTKGEKYFF